jgi:hypothetical protein
MSHASQATKTAPPATGTTLDVEFLYLDLTTCTRCQGTEASLREALAVVRPLLDALGLTAALRSTKVTTVAQAQRLGLVSSPTIRINGRDIAPALKESTCGPCSDLCGEATACRVWTYQGQEFTEPPVGLILAAIVRELASGVTAAPLPSTLTAGVPENLERFFAGAAESVADACCTDAEQATCCAAEEKAACCGEASGSRQCGCR